MDAKAEADLIGRCRQGDADAWAVVFDIHYAAVGRFLFQLGHEFSREDVDELCQEVFLAAIKHLGSFQGQSRLQTWLFRIALNKAADLRERAKAAKRGGGTRTISLQSETVPGELPLEPPSPEPGPDRALQEAERFAGVYRALDAVGLPCREIIELRYFGDLSYEEIAEALDLNPKTVSSRLSRCLDQLEDILKTVYSTEAPSRLTV
jgi:RNA polymerase sigma-70 factor (ECF subfamily)